MASAGSDARRNDQLRRHQRRRAASPCGQSEGNTCTSEDAPRNLAFTLRKRPGPYRALLWPRPSATRYPISAATARKTVPIRKATLTSREHGFASKQSSAPTATANSSIGLALVADHDSSLSALQVCSAGTGNPDKSDVLGGASAGAPVHMSRSLAAKSAGACLLSCYQPRLPRVARGHRA